MKAELKQYKKEPDPFWQECWRYGDGYDVMESAERQGWHPMSSWGKEGYDLGSWPYVIIFYRYWQEQYQLVYYVEGDVTMYVCPTKEIRRQITDELAFFHWKHQEADWVQGYDSVEQIPTDLRGPYRSS